MKEGKLKFDSEKFRERIAERRKELGLTQEEVADKARISRQRYSTLENAPVQEIKMKTCAAIAIALDSTIDVLTDGCFSYPDCQPR